MILSSLTKTTHLHDYFNSKLNYATYILIEKSYRLTMQVENLEHCTISCGIIFQQCAFFERIVRLLASTAYYANPFFFSLSLLNEDGSSLNKYTIIPCNGLMYYLCSY